MHVLSYILSVHSIIVVNELSHTLFVSLTSFNTLIVFNYSHYDIRAIKNADYIHITRRHGILSSTLLLWDIARFGTS